MGTFAAQWVIGLWIPFTFYLFSRYSAPRATLYAYFGGLLVLPNWVAIKLPLFPGISKESIAGLALLLVMAIRKPAGIRPSAEPWFYVAFIGIVASNLLTGFTNPDPITFTSAPIVIPGHDFKDTGALVMGAIIGVVPISYAGLRMFRTVDDLRLLVRVITICGLIYSIPILIELRLSPQFHNWVYGFAGPHQWGQLIRHGGYRPLVMMTHGLVLSLFMLMPAVTASSLARSGERIWRLSGNQAAWFLTLIIILCKSTGVWFYAAIALPMVRLCSSKVLLRTAMVLCLITCLYPYLRANEMIATKDLTNWIETWDVDRAQSLDFRFVNENQLLAKAMERPWFGWGSYGRNRVYDEFGIDRCVTDGAWVLLLGTVGYVGFFFRYLLSVGAMLIASRRIAKIRDSELRNTMAALIFGCAFLWFDTLPNAPDFYIVEFVAAAICSISRTVLADQERSRFKKPAGALDRSGRDPLIANAS